MMLLHNETPNHLHLITILEVDVVGMIRPLLSKNGLNGDPETVIQLQERRRRLFGVLRFVWKSCAQKMESGLILCPIKLRNLDF